MATWPRLRIWRYTLVSNSILYSYRKTRQLLWIQTYPPLFLLCLIETFSAAVYIGIIFAVVIPGIICCCCAIKCCRRKSSAKRDEPAAAASYRVRPSSSTLSVMFVATFTSVPLFQLQSQNQPADPINAAVPAPDYSYRTVNTLASGQLPTPSSGPPVRSLTVMCFPSAGQ